MSEHSDEYRETPRWRLLMYPLGGMIAVAAIFAAWIALN